MRGLAVIAVLCGTACRQGRGTLGDIEYRVELPGSYSLARSDEREHVWVPSNDDRPIVSLRVTSRPQKVGEGPTPCDGKPGSIGTSSGGFIWSRSGSAVELKSTGSPDGVAIHFERCIPPGARELTCMANYSDGKMSEGQKKLAEQICRSLGASP